MISWKQWAIHFTWEGIGCTDKWGVKQVGCDLICMPDWCSPTARCCRRHAGQEESAVDFAYREAICNVLQLGR